MRSDLTATNLAEAILDRADLKDACFLRNARLHGAYLEHAKDLTGADRRGATADEETIWPKGFDPAKHGVALVPTEPVNVEPHAGSARNLA